MTPSFLVPDGITNRRRFKPYPSYKDCGVEWLGEIPAHWKVTRIRESADVINGYPFDSEHFTLGEGVPLVRIRDLYTNTTEVNYLGPVVEEAWIDNGDVLVGMDGNFNVARWRGGRALLNQRMCCIREKRDTEARLIAYVLPFPLKVINDLTYSTTVKHLSSLDVEKFRWGRPPLQEQRAIAAFLDRETAKIDALVAKKERLIELLQEKRAALITQAVTKGLPSTGSGQTTPTVPMKDSGIEWLGKIPRHWEIKKLKYVVKGGFVNGLFKKKDQYGTGVKLINVVNLYEKNFLIDFDTLEYVEADPEELNTFLVSPGDIFFVRSSLKLEGVGSSACAVSVPEPTVFECHLVRVRPSQTQISPECLVYCLNSSLVRQRLIALAETTTMTTIAQPKLASLDIVVPSLSEQRDIAAYLDLETAKIDALITKVHEGIETLKEYRTALISAAVTGKIDVRGSA